MLTGILNNKQISDSRYNNMAMNFLGFWQLLHTAESYYKYNMAMLAHDVIIISYSECFQILSIISTTLYPSWYINTFIFQRPSNETPSSSISRARGVSFPKHSFTLHYCVWVVYLIHMAQSNGHIFGYGNEKTRSYVHTVPRSFLWD
jgi:hypothetical protein